MIQRIAPAPGEDTDPERLLEVLAELGPAHRAPATAASPHGEPRDGDLPLRAERLVSELRAGLARLAESWRGDAAEIDAPVEHALDSAEFLARWHLLGGRGARIPQLLPSFVYLVLSPRSGPPAALSESRRAARLLQGWESPASAID